MTLYMNRKEFKWGNTIELSDTSGRSRYLLNGEAYSFGKRLHVTDLAGREAITISQQIPSLFPRYAIDVYGKPVGELIKDLSYSHAHYLLTPEAWELIGSGYHYEIILDGDTIACCHMDNQKADPVLAMDFHQQNTALHALGIFLTINCILR